MSTKLVSKMRNFFLSFYSLAENGFFHLILSSLTICEHPLALKVAQIDVRYKFVVEQCAHPKHVTDTIPEGKNAFSHAKMRMHPKPVTNT